MVKLRKSGALGSMSSKNTLQEELGDGWQGCGSAGDSCTSAGPAGDFSWLRVLVGCSSPSTPFLVCKICRNVTFLVNFNPAAVISVGSEIGEEGDGEAKDHRRNLSFYPAFLKNQLCLSALKGSNKINVS